VPSRPRSATIAPIVWRDGVHLSGTPIWCDARRRRDVCFVSSAERVGRTGHGQLIATAETLALLDTRGDGHLAVPLRRRFTLGTLRLELIPSGRGLGAAALHVDIAGRTVLYAGAIRTAAGGLGEPAEVRTCDAVVVAAPLGDRRVPPLAQVADELHAWVRTQLAQGRWPLVFADDIVDAVEIAARLGTPGTPSMPVTASKVVREAAARAGLPAIGAPGREPAPIVWLARDRAGAARAIGAKPSAIATASAAQGADFCWATAAPNAQVAEWIRSTGARDIYVTGAGAEALAKQLGPRAHAIGPPQQMALFPEASA
jgi:putative mRNA 3-end processing factor